MQAGEATHPQDQDRIETLKSWTLRRGARRRKGGIVSKRLCWIGLMVWVLAAFGRAAIAEESTAAAPAGDERSWSLEGGIDYSDHYLFRGVDLLAEGAVLSPHVKLAAGAWSLSYYGYLGEIPETSDGYHEADFGLDYTFTFGKLALSLGALTYQYDGAVERQMAFFDTYELYAIASLDVPLAPTLSFYRDVDAVEGGYAALGVSHGFEMRHGLALDLSASLGFDFGYNLNAQAAAGLGVEKSNGDLNDFLAGADLSWTVSDALSVHALVQRSVSLDVLDRLGQPDVTVWTLGATVAF
jgi:hypothetical protein